MAKKRALVDAVLTATAASDIFTQDLEDITANIASTAPAPVPASDGGSLGSRWQTAVHRHRPGRSVRRTPATDFVEPVGNDFRETRVHFGKNRGLMLSELTPQQVHWYETDWMPKKEVNGPTSVEDLALMNALKAYRAWRGQRVEARVWS